MTIPPGIAAWFSKWGMAVILGALLLAATFSAGKLHERAAWKENTVSAVKAALKTERAGVTTAAQADGRHQAELKTQLEKAHEELAKLRAALSSVGSCPVPRRVVRLLDGGGRVSAAPGSAAKPEAAAAPVAPDTGADAGADAGAGPIECAAVIDNCAHNRLNVCEPNALQLENVQRFYDELRQRFNKQP